MKVFEINNDDEFEFKAVVTSFGDDGKQHLFCNYKKEYDNKMTVTLEGMATSSEMNIKDKVKYSAFRRKFPEHRIYLQGYTLVEK